MLWDYLATLNDVPSILGGDFNMIEHQDEKSGGNPFEWKPSEKPHWDRLIQHKDLLDPLLGNKSNHGSVWYTWCNYQKGANRIYSRLDCFYINKNYFTLVPDEHGTTISIRPATINDHHPFAALIKISNSSPTPACSSRKFLLNTSLLQDPIVLAAISMVRFFNSNDHRLLSPTARWIDNLSAWQKILQTFGQKKAIDSRRLENALSCNLFHLEAKLQLSAENEELLSQLTKARDALR